MKRPVKEIVAALAMSTLSISAAAAQNFPDREINLVVPFAPGGSTDFVARTVGAGLEQALGQPVLVQNMPGANTIVGTEHVARSAPDGYTLVVATNGHTTNSYMYSELPYDAESDFAPVALIGRTPNVIAANAQIEAQNLSDLIESYKASEEVLFYATAGHGTIQHFTGALLTMTADIKGEHIPYRGGGPAADDVMAGHVPVLISGMPPAMPHIEAGRLNPLAVTSSSRSPALPDTPTTEELGFPQVESSFYLAILAPAGTPVDVIAILNDAINDVLQDEDIRSRLESQGVMIDGGSPEELGDFLSQDAALWSSVIEQSGIEMIE